MVVSGALWVLSISPCTVVARTQMGANTSKSDAKALRCKRLRRSCHMWRGVSISGCSLSERSGVIHILYGSVMLWERAEHESKAFHLLAHLDSHLHLMTINCGWWLTEWVAPSFVRRLNSCYSSTSKVASWGGLGIRTIRPRLPGVRRCLWRGRSVNCI